MKSNKNNTGGNAGVEDPPWLALDKDSNAHQASSSSTRHSPTKGGRNATSSAHHNTHHHSTHNAGKDEAALPPFLLDVNSSSLPSPQPRRSSGGTPAITHPVGNNNNSNNNTNNNHHSGDGNTYSPAGAYTHTEDSNSLRFSFEPPKLPQALDSMKSSTGRRDNKKSGGGGIPLESQASSGSNNSGTYRPSGTAYTLGRLSKKFSSGDFPSGGEPQSADYKGATSAKALLAQLQKQNAQRREGMTASEGLRREQQTSRAAGAGAAYKATGAIKTKGRGAGTGTTPPPPEEWLGQPQKKEVGRPPTGPLSPGGAASLARAEPEGEGEAEAPAADQIGLEPFLAAEMPRGRYVVLNLLTTWGDLNEVGLCGVEFFDERGRRVVPSAAPTYENSVSNKTPSGEDASTAAAASRDGAGGSQQEMHIDEEGLTTLTYTVGSGAASLQLMAAYRASPEELEAVGSPEQMRAVRTDPRRQLANLLNDRNLTHDERAMFAMPYTSGRHHLVCFLFSEPVCLSMVRVFNYCGQGRVHTSKGARIAEMTVDDDVVFRGELGRHDGELHMPSEEHPLGVTDCENILFTEDPEVLERVMSLYAPINACAALTQPPGAAGGRGSGEEGPRSTFVFRAKSAAGGGGGGGEDTDCVGAVPSGIALSTQVQREVEAAAKGTSGGGARAASSDARGAPSAGAGPLLDRSRRAPGAARAMDMNVSEASSKKVTRVAQFPSNCPRNVTSLCFLILSTWGDTLSVGLSGLRFRDANGDLVKQTIGHWHVQYPSGEHEGDRQLAAQLACLFDERPDTAALLPFQPGVQIVLEFSAPIPQLGFLEVANYSVGDKTFCGAKEVRLFMTSTSDFAATSGYRPTPINTIYAHLWVVGASAESVKILRERGVYEVTPTDGVTMRKAPAALSRPRFQTYDLSMQGGSGGGNGSGAVADILVGPGTGGERHSSASGGMTFSAAGAGAGFFNTSVSASFTGSLNASMNIRAAAAMRRARMALWERPDWLLDYQPYITPLLPIGYVCKVRLDISARQTPSSSGNSSGSGSSSGSAQENLKAYLKVWIVKPFRAVSFVNENGQVVVPVRPGKSLKEVKEEARERERRVGKRTNAGGGKADDGDDDDEFSNYVPMVAESSVTTFDRRTADVYGGASASSGSRTSTPAAAAAPLAVTVDLMFVADVPFCLSLLSLHRPLVLPGSTAWVKRLRVLMDDTAVYDSGEAVIEVDQAALSKPGATATGSTAALPPCKSSIRPFVVFTLDADILAEVRTEMQNSSS